MYEKGIEESDYSIDREYNASNGFVAKVYGILGAQLVLTTLFTAISLYSQTLQNFQLNNSWAYILALIIVVACEIAIFCSKKAARSYPYNYLIMLVFTLAQSYLVSMICSVVQQSYSNGGDIVLLAASMTLALVAGLSLLATYMTLTRREMSYCFYTLSLLSLVLLITGIALIFTNNQTLTIIYCGLGILVFGCYMVIDTMLILSNEKYGLSYDDFVVAAMILYIDIIQLFLYILRLLAKTKGERN